MYSELKRYRYKAFISYNHKDKNHARRLHRGLETYKLPKTLAKDRRPALYPVFLDESELTAGATLSDSIQAALTDSAYLIVICSENAVGSRWVQAEISFMRSLGRADDIISVIPSSGADESHVRSLLRDENTDTADGAEHLAADFRRGNNRRLQFLKIVSTLTGHPLDGLYQRESQRKLRAYTIMSAGMAALTVVMSALAWKAYSSEQEVIRQRAKSEQVLEFMITEFHDDLEKLGRLELLSRVGEKAQDYFEDRKLSDLPDSSVRIQSRTLRQLSDVDEKRGELTTAKLRQQSAVAASEQLRVRYPDNVDILLEHAENNEMLGFIHYQLGDLAAARKDFEEGAKHLSKAQQLKPDESNIVWRRGIAEQNLGVMILQTGQSEAALPHIESGIKRLESIKPEMDLTEEQWFEFANGYTWYLRALPDTTPMEFLFETRDKQLGIFQSLEKNNPDAYTHRGERLNIERAIVILLLNSGRDAEAESLMRKIQAEFSEMLEHDPENIGWRRHLMRSKQTLARLHHKRGEIDHRNRELEEVLSLWEKEGGKKWLVTSDIVLSANRLRARKAFEEQSAQEAIKILVDAETEIRNYRKEKIRPLDKYNIASLNSLKASFYHAEGDEKAAQDTQKKVINLLSAKDSYTISEQLLLLRAYKYLNLTDKEADLRTLLETKGIVLDI